MNENTNYGYKKTGSSKFVIVAPHAAGDDLKSGFIAKKLAQELNAYLVVNKFYKKPNNSQALKNPHQVEDFNELTWSEKKEKYLWSKKNPVMKEFFQDIEKFSYQAKQFSSNNKALIIYIHSFTSDHIGIDIGAGAKHHNFSNKIFGSLYHKEKGDNHGKITLPINLIKKIKKELEKKVKIKYNLTTTVGYQYSGWSRQSAVQFHCHEGRNDYSIQFEISQHLRRNKSDLDYTIQILTETIKKYL